MKNTLLFAIGALLTISVKAQDNSGSINKEGNLITFDQIIENDNMVLIKNIKVNFLGKTYRFESYNSEKHIDGWSSLCVYLGYENYIKSDEHNTVTPRTMGFLPLPKPKYVISVVNNTMEIKGHDYLIKNSYSLSGTMVMPRGEIKNVICKKNN